MSFHFDPKEGLILIPTGICGPNGDTIVMLALDTGATGSTINWDLLVLLGYDPAIIKDRVQMTTGSGVEYVPKITVDKIKALGKEMKGFEFLCHTLPPSATVDGVLGLDFLRDGHLIIDFQRTYATTLISYRGLQPQTKIDTELTEIDETTESIKS